MNSNTITQHAVNALVDATVDHVITNNNRGMQIEFHDGSRGQILKELATGIVNVRLGFEAANKSEAEKQLQAVYTGLLIRKEGTGSTKQQSISEIEAKSFATADIIASQGFVDGILPPNFSELRAELTEKLKPSFAELKSELAPTEDNQLPKRTDLLIPLLISRAGFGGRDILNQAERALRDRYVGLPKINGEKLSVWNAGQFASNAMATVQEFVNEKLGAISR